PESSSSAVQVMVATACVTSSPCAPSTGSSKVRYSTSTRQPGTAAVVADGIGGAPCGESCIRSLVVGVSPSFGTRNTTRAELPGTASSACTLTWAAAGVARNSDAEVTTPARTSPSPVRPAAPRMSTSRVMSASYLMTSYLVN